MKNPVTNSYKLNNNTIKIMTVTEYFAVHDHRTGLSPPPFLPIEIKECGGTRVPKDSSCSQNQFIIHCVHFSVIIPKRKRKENRGGGSGGSSLSIWTTTTVHGWMI